LLYIQVKGHVMEKKKDRKKYKHLARIRFSSGKTNVKV
jgi:hypothetical protein